MNYDLQTVQSHIHRYFAALYGESYVYRAPETFDNALERWMLLVCADAIESASKQMTEIEAMIRRDRA